MTGLSNFRNDIHGLHGGRYSSQRLISRNPKRSFAVLASHLPCFLDEAAKISTGFFVELPLDGRHHTYGEVSAATMGWTGMAKWNNLIRLWFSLHTCFRRPSCTPVWFYLEMRPHFLQWTCGILMALDGSGSGSSLIGRRIEWLSAVDARQIDFELGEHQQAMWTRLFWNWLSFPVQFISFVRFQWVRVNCCIQAAGCYTTPWLFPDVCRVPWAGVGGAFGVSGLAHDYIENCELWNPWHTLFNTYRFWMFYFPPVCASLMVLNGSDSDLQRHLKKTC